MSQATNIFTSKPQAAPAAAGAQGAYGGSRNVRGADGQDDFAKFVTSLLDVSATQSNQNSGPIQSQTSIDQSSSISLEGLIDVEALIQATKKLENGGEGADPIAALIESLLAKLNDVTSPNAATGALGADGNTLASVTDALSTLLASVENNGKNIPSSQLDQLLKLSEALKSIQADAGLISDQDKAQLEQLMVRADKLIRGTNPAIAQQASQAVDPEVNNVVAMLFGESEANKATSAGIARDLRMQILNTDGTASKPDISALQAISAEMASAGKKAEGSTSTTPQMQAAMNAEKTNNLFGITGAPSVTGKSENTTNAGTLAAAMANGTAGAKLDNLVGEAKQDPLLLAQSQASASQKTDFAAQLRASSATYNTPTQNLNMPHIAVEIARNVNLGNSRFQIRLDPPEMGKIDVAMDLDKAGNLHARLTVERAETLDLLQRDARALERALAQSGLDGARTNLEFALKQNPFNQPDPQHRQDSDFIEAQNRDETADQVEDKITQMTQLYRGNISPGGVNLWA